MKKLQRFNNVRPNNAEQEDWFWDQILFEEDLTCHARKTDYPALKSKARVRKAQNRTIQNMQPDDFVED